MFVVNTVPTASPVAVPGERSAAPDCMATDAVADMRELFSLCYDCRIEKCQEDWRAAATPAANSRQTLQ